VQGVTNSIRNPICKSTLPCRKTLPSRKTRIGVRAKLIESAAEENLTLLNDFVIWRMSTQENTTNSMTIKNTSMNPAE
jgi:hypothetical protein